MAYSSGFSYPTTAGGDGVTTRGSFTFSETPSKGWLACPVVSKNGPWQVFAFIRRTNSTGCMEFEADVEAYEGGAVWQYD